MYTVDIHKYGQTIPEALYELKEAISMGKHDKDHVVKVICGYGSSGGTHKIKTQVLAYLEEKKGHGIKDYILGNELVDYSVKFFSFKYLDRIPKEEKIHGNPGVIYIIV